MSIKIRKQIDNEFKWDLKDIFKSRDEFEKVFLDIKTRLSDLEQYQDNLACNEKLLECLRLTSELNAGLSSLYQYAKLGLDLDTASADGQELVSRVEMLVVSLSTASSFITPEIAEFDTLKLQELQQDKLFQDYSVYFKNIERDKKIILSKSEEKLLSELSLFADTNDEVFSMFDNADIIFDKVELLDGSMSDMSHGIYSLLLQNESQTVRQRAFESMFNAFKNHINMLGANYAGNIKKDWFYAKIRKFDTSLDYAMYTEDVSQKCYEKLIDAVNRGTDELHRYIGVRKKALGVDTLNMYDLHVPIVKSQNLGVDYATAKQLVLDALAVSGDKYQSLLVTAFAERWIDVYETKNKRSGAYSWGSYGRHPFVLLNYQKTTHDIFTIAHELGHAMHSYLSNQSLPREKAGYVIFLAEIASTVNEVLLLKHMLKTATGDMRTYLLSYYLDMFRTTIFRQTMFSEFEVLAHNLVEQNQPVSADIFSNLYYDLNKKYYGKDVEHNELIKYEWARIPHFYSSFYVFKYATGLISAITIASKILDRGEEYFAKYEQFLSAGGSMSPEDILALAEVDLKTDQPYETMLKEFADTLGELEKQLS